MKKENKQEEDKPKKPPKGTSPFKDGIVTRLTNELEPLAGMISGATNPLTYDSADRITQLMSLSPSLKDVTFPTDLGAATTRNFIHPGTQPPNSQFPAPFSYQTMTDAVTRAELTRNLPYSNGITFPTADAANLSRSTLTPEEIGELIRKNFSEQKKNSLSKEQAVELYKEIAENEAKKKEETLSADTENALTFFKKELLAGKEFAWHCAICKERLDIFTGEEGIEKMYSFLTKFRNNVFKPCSRHGHQNWFEIKADGFVLMAKNDYKKVFKEKRLDTGL